jgi:hypothetical protein
VGMEGGWNWLRILVDDKFKMNRREISCGDGRWVELAQDLS